MLNDNDVNLIRDAATLLEKQNPKLSYELFSLALINRPNGPYLKKMEHKLRQQLGLKTFVVIGNCQARVNNRLLEIKNDNLISKGSIVAHLHRHSDYWDAVLESVDYIITQNISDKFKGINTTILLDKYPEKLVRLPSLFFWGYHPDWCYMPERLQSPIGDYHNKTIAKSFVSGLSEEETLSDFLSFDYNERNYTNVAKDSLEELERRELTVDIKMSDVVRDNYEKGKVTFHTMNHPKNELLDIQIERVLSYLGVESNGKTLEKEGLDGVMMRTNPIFNGNRLEDSYKNGNILDVKKFIKDSFLIYTANPEIMDKFKANLP